MHPKEFKGFIEHISEAYATLYDEVHKLQRENKSLLDEMAKRRHVAQAAAQRPEGAAPSMATIHKMGANWHIEGDYLVSLSLMRRLKFCSPICNVRISKRGQIAFTCNKKIFLLREERFYVVDDGIKPYDPGQMKNDLTENFRCIFDFDEENLVVYTRNNIVKYENDRPAWSIPVGSSYHMMVSEGLIYVGTRDYKVLVFRGTECVKIVEHMDVVRFFVVSGGAVLGCSDFKVSVLGKGPSVTEGARMLALDASGSTIYYGGEAAMLKVGRLGPTLEVVDTLAMKKPVLAIKMWRSYVLVACQDKSLAVWSIQQRKCMRVVGSDNIIDIAVNDDTICCVDNNGSLRIWQARK